MRTVPSTLLLVTLLAPLAASGNTLAVRSNLPNVGVPEVGRSVHLVDFRSEGVDYYLSARLVSRARSSSDTGVMSLGVVVALPSAPSEVEVVPSGLLTGFDRATSGEVKACSAGSSGCSQFNDMGGSSGAVGIPEGGNVPLRGSLLASTAADAIAFLEGHPLQVDDALKGTISGIYDAGLVAWVGYLADQDAKLLFGLGGVSRAVSLRFSFPGSGAPFRIPLHIQQSDSTRTQGEVGTNVILLGRGLGFLDGVEVVRVDPQAVHSPIQDPDQPPMLEPTNGDPAFSPRNFDQVVRETLAGRGGGVYVRETAQFLHLARVSGAMPTCALGEDGADCFNQDCFDGPCPGPIPPDPPPFDAGSPARDGGVSSDGGTGSDGGPSGSDADAGSSDAGFVHQTTAHSALSHIFFEDRFATRLTTLSRPSALRPIAVRVDGSPEGIGPEYRNCPAPEEDGGCSSARGSSRFALIFLAVALLMRKRVAR